MSDSLSPDSIEVSLDKSAASPVDLELLSKLKAHLQSVCPALFSSSSSLLGASLAQAETEEILKTFITDSMSFALIVHRKLQKSSSSSSDDVESYSFELSVKAGDDRKSVTPSSAGSSSSSLAFLKIAQSLDSSQPFSNQLYVSSFSENSPFETILSYVRHLFLPFSRSFVGGSADSATGQEKKESELAVYRGVNRKLGELEVELLRFQENVDIPMISLELHPVVGNLVKSAKLTGKPLKVEDLGDLASSAEFLNEIQQGLNEWKKVILRVTKLNRDVSSGSTIQELNFWSAMERAISHIYEQRDSVGVEFTFNLLKQNKRFLATTGFNQDVGLAEQKDKDKVFRYQELLRELPIKRLLAAPDVAEIARSVEALFNHIKQIRRIDYPLSRSIQLVQAISRDLVIQLQTVLNTRRLLALNFDEFIQLVNGCDEVFNMWNSKVGEFIDLVRTIHKKKPGESIAKLNDPYTELNDLRARIAEIRRLRKEHEELRAVISDTLANDQYVRNSALEAINTAFTHLQRSDVLNITNDGKESFESNVASYASQIDRVEGELEMKIRQFLDAAKDDANEMFRVCAKFNALFVRPRIQSAIREYQEQLIATVKKDIQGLQNKFNSRVAKLEQRKMSKLHDMPPVSASMIWAKQIERQLNIYMNHVENVLGKQWHHHIEGRSLKRDTDDFRAKLKPTRLNQAWLMEKQEQAAQLQAKGSIFKIVATSKHVSLAVNFDKKLITLFKEVRNLSRLDVKIPFELIATAEEAKQNYPFAMRLEEVIRIYSRTCQRLDSNKQLASLAAGLKKSMQDSIQKGVNLQWFESQVKSYVDQLGTQAIEFQDQVEELTNWIENAQKALKKLEEAKPDSAHFKAVLIELQAVVDHLDKRGFANLEEFAHFLDSQVESILVRRLGLIVQCFVKALQYDPETGALLEDENKQKRLADLKDAKLVDDEEDEEREKNQKEADSLGMDFRDFILKEPIKHEILIRNQVLQLDPPLENARLALTRALNMWLAMVCELPRLRLNDSISQSLGEDGKRIVGGRLISSSGESDDGTYRLALTKLDPAILTHCFNEIESKLGSAYQYSESWLQYQALWDLDIEVIVHDLGQDLSLWERLLVDMKKARGTFDNADKRRKFGPILIEYGSVQSKVNNKYDQWHKTILARFGAMLGERIVQLLTAIRSGRDQLEKHSFDFTNTAEIVDSVTILQELAGKAKVWESELEKQKSVEKLLQRQRFLFPADWMFSDRVEGEWHAFQQILQRKLAKMHEEAPNIQGKIGAEDLAIDSRIKDFTNEWKKSRPLQGDLDHKVVENLLTVCDSKLQALENDLNRLNAAKRALDMQVKDEFRLQPIREELAGLREVWAHLASSWKELDSIGEKLFRDVKPSEIRKQITKIQNDVQKLPNHMRQYDAFEHLRGVIKNYLAMNGSLVELHSGVLRPKHEKQLLKELGLPVHWNELTVGMLWQKDLKAHAKAVKHILDQAQGEGALEEFLNELREQWEATKFDLVDYRGKNFLVRNWDQLFSQLTDRLSDLSGMKQSPFYKAFEREAGQWEAKLNLAQAIFDLFIDIQRRWVYLEGIMNGSQDVQIQLAAQFKRFKTFDKEFVRLMRDIKKEPAIDAWVREERHLVQELEGYAETLNGIQKALGEYLERQRSAFPRFYFVGDEDLLEIIGNAKNPIKILRHLNKMFAGLNSLDISEDQKMIMGMSSKEGETVKFKQAVILEENTSVHAWLNAVQYQMRFTLACLMEESINELNQLDSQSQTQSPAYIEALFSWINKFPAQIVLLSTQVQWSTNVEAVLANHSASPSAAALQTILQRIENSLELLADRILRSDLTGDIRKKYEQLITERVHQRDVTRQLIKDGVSSPSDFRWVGTMRYVFTPYKGLKSGLVGQSQSDMERADPPELKVLEVRISRARFQYGFEYLGVSERLVQTPLTDQCYLTLAEALHMRLGGNPFGPAGTGKTETVKALSAQLGYFCLVFNCDEAFDLQAMGRIFVGLCQCGAWGCFDEFNRLEERILSAVSQQILTIQTGIRDNSSQIQLMGKSVRLDSRMGLFVTMNPGYAGRSELPDNLKSLFRGIAMIKPDYLLIAQVMLYSQGFRSAEELSGKIVLLFSLCEAQLSSRPHYDFGLRALKSVLRSAGELKRKAINSIGEGDEQADSAEKLKSLTSAKGELDLLLKSICSTIVPKLVSHDVTLFSTLVKAVFPQAEMSAPPMPKLREMITKVCQERHFADIQSWVDKVLQLYEIQSINHGVIMVGPTATGKSSAWSVLKEALERVEETKIGTYVIDPKAISKEELYGSLDNTTLEWTDGVFTSLLRKILDNIRGESGRRHWIIFDGDVDPEWAENLNSVLDDNKLLTLPNGERLALTPNIRIMFEVQNLNFATPATVSRCGMVWFSREVLHTAAIVRRFLLDLKFSPLEHANIKSTVYQRWKSVQERCVEILEPLVGIPTAGEMKTEEMQNSFVLLALEWSAKQNHIMKFNRQQALLSLFSLLKGGIAKVIEYDDNHADFPLNDQNLEAFLGKHLVFSVLWSFGGSLSLANRVKFGEELAALCPSSISMPANKSVPLIDFEVKVESGEWENWSERVESIELDPHKVIRSDVVIDTVDTVRHSEVVGQWLADRKPLILCGPAGSGKSMTLTAVLKSMPEFDLVTLNFSSSTSPTLILDCLAHHCKVERTPNGLLMKPVNVNKWLCIFADEINLPAEDKYKTQHVITLLRQIGEHGGFWRASDLQFIKLERIQIIGACNPPTDAGRVVLSPRFLRHTPLLFVDFPGAPALRQIYGTFNRALLKLQPTLRGHWEAMTDCMIEIYSQSQAKFTPDIQPHYVYSPRELSRWVRALYEAIKPADSSTSLSGWDINSLCRLLLHEALRLFQDRLVDKAEREWTDRVVDAAIRKHFPSLDHGDVLARPVMFSNWLSKQYQSVERDALRTHVKNRLKVFYEEELDVKLVIFDEVLEHILRIDRVLRQPLGHLLLVGVSGGGKTVLSKFVAWMNGMSVFQIKVHKYYTGKDFDKDLRSVLIRAGCKGENICFIFDESNVLDTAFLERMNALLAGGEVPGLFEGQDYTALMAECKEMARRENLMLESEEELFSHFTAQVQRRLHVVFTMNPANEDFNNRSATSPALFSRCVTIWFGEWSSQALYQVGFEFTKTLDLGDGVIEELDHEDDERPSGSAQKGSAVAKPSTEREAVVSTLVYVHESVRQANAQLSASSAGRSSYVTPRHYLDFIKQYSGLFHEKRSQLEDQQRHLNTGLRKLRETSEEVAKLQQELTVKDAVLRENQKKANDKLELMMIDKREAEAKRDVSVQIAAEIKEQEAIIAQRREAVEKELAEAKPALEDAEAAVKGIKKTDLDQVSRFPNPPAPVKLAMEAVVIMLGEGKLGWEDIRKVLRRADFIKSVIDYDIEKVSEKIRKQIQKEYLSDPNMAYDVVNNASKACGPLVKWVESTLNFARIKNSVAPLEDEMKQLEEKANLMKVKQAELTKIQEELGVRIDQLKVEYSALIGEVERIKNEMSTVQQKVDRSTSLLANLSSERSRWEADSSSFQSQISTVVGDCLLAAAFLAYVGYFNQNWRQFLVDSWQSKLDAMKVKTRSDLSMIEYLSHPSERLEWQSNQLPSDDLNMSNAIMLKRFNRYPLIIDPSGMACDFLMKQYKDRKIIRTSFLDDAFLKNLESALRFGNALLVEDVESIDPILNSVLNKEIRKNGGRVMIGLGDKEIDFSPSFVIFLSTRDPLAHFTPDLASRVTFVNFTVTHSSLSAQCLSKVLRAERKDIDAKRSDLLKLQGEFRVRLRTLEDSLLNALSSVRGNILDDDAVLKTLETLKSEAAEVQQKMSESERVMEECTTAANQYSPFASACSSIYFALEKLSEVHFLYQFSLPLFLGIVDKLLSPATSDSSDELKDNRDYLKRLHVLTRMLFENTFAKVVRSLQNRDQIAFALRLAQIALDEANLAQPIEFAEFDFFLRGAASSSAPVNTPPALGISRSIQQLIADASQLAAFRGLGGHISSSANSTAWAAYLQSPTTVHEQKREDGESKHEESHAMEPPTGWESSASAPAHVKAFRSLIIAKLLRPDRVPVAAAAFVRAVFGPRFPLSSATTIDLVKLIQEESTASVPLLLVSKPGFDASYRVDQLASDLNNRANYQSFAMGSPEGYEQADVAINNAVKKGGWILLKNVHLSPAWLSQLEKRLHRMTFHPNFRLFLTMELNPKVPSNFLRMSNVLIFEPPVGLKASMKRMFAQLPQARISKAPVERARLYFLLSWLHAIILERLRYTPVGWSKAFEFSETDAQCALDAIDEWIDKTAAGKANLAPEKIPWDAIQKTLEQVVYGGRIDNEFDQLRLSSFVRSIFVSKSFDAEFALSSHVTAQGFSALLKIPDVNNFEGFKRWIEEMDENSSPELLGLPVNAELMLLQQQAAHAVKQLATLQDHSRIEESKDSLQVDEESGASSEDSKATRPAWMVTMEGHVIAWISKLPSVQALKDASLVNQLTKAKQVKELELLFQNPLFRCVQREFTIYCSLLETVIADLTLLRDVFNGTLKGNNRARELIQFIKRDKVPAEWFKPYPALKHLSVSTWVEDFVRRLDQIKRLVSTKAESYQSETIWLGGFTSPEGFVAATRQIVAARHNWPLEQLELRMEVKAAETKDSGDSFYFSGLTLQCAAWDSAGQSLGVPTSDTTGSNTLHSALAPVRFFWVHQPPNQTQDNKLVSVPVYIDSHRSGVRFSIKLKRPSNSAIPSTIFYDRGTCLTVWNEEGAGDIKH